MDPGKKTPRPKKARRPRPSPDKRCRGKNQPRGRQRLLFKGKFLELAAIGSWEFAQRIGNTQAIGIIAVTPSKKLLLISQYRVPVAKRVIEIPAGLVGDGPGGNGRESWQSGARRELREETGWLAKEFKWLTRGPSSAGMTSECLVFVGARKLSRGSGQQLEDGENIEVHEVPLQGIETWLREREAAGMLVDPKVWAALYFVHRRK